MAMKSRNFSIFAILLALILLPPSAGETQTTWITSTFADENSMDVSIQSSKQVNNGQLIFKLTSQGKLIETTTLDFAIAQDQEITKIIMWDSEPQYETYVAKVSVLVDGKPVDEISYPFSYGFVSLPRFQVVDLSASSSGANLLLKPWSVQNPGVADFIFQLIRDGEIIYSETKEDIPVVQSTQLSIDWPILLDDRTEYNVRVKATSHTPDIISSYVTRFTAKQEVEIDDMDVDVDDFGVSVTLYGRSQVPFDGIVEVELYKDGSDPFVFKGRSELLTLNRDDTVGIVWDDDLDPGTYQVNIHILTLEYEILDRYETMLFIPERDYPATQPTQSKTPGFGIILAILGIIYAVVINSRR
jgi:hypothetical protein